jgi:integrase
MAWRNPLTNGTPSSRSLSSRWRESARDRVLNDDEVRTFWSALEKEEEAGRYLIAAFYRIRLLTAQRGREQLRMKWSESPTDPRRRLDDSEQRHQKPRSHRVPPVAAVIELVKTTVKGKSPRVMSPRSLGDHENRARWRMARALPVDAR